MNILEPYNINVANKSNYAIHCTTLPHVALQIMREKKILNLLEPEALM